LGLFVGFLAIILILTTAIHLAWNQGYRTKVYYPNI
jgi:hypothetical protein